MDAENIKKILVIDLAFIGDVILATPTMRALKEHFPKASLTMLTIPLTAEIAAMNPYVDEVLVYDKRGKDKGILGIWRMARRLAPFGFDLCVSMNFALRGAVVARLAGIPHRLGYDAQHAGFFLTMVASHERDGIKHETRNHLEVLRPLGLDDKAADVSLSMNIPESAWESLEKKREERHIPEDGYLALCPIGSYARKNLPLATAAHIVRHFSQRRPIFLIGGKSEAAQLEEIAGLAELPRNNVLAGILTLSELAAFLEKASCLSTVDTGPLHIAQAVGCRTVAVFGPTDPVVWGPRGENDVILFHKTDCSPCWGKGNCEKHMACIEGATAREIIKAVGR
ncbi:MAG: glycosyltransferase family 9 protein [Schwartzia sp.]|nr:glycosyltransferase family 9 protein [Schwartzia sp. (in: firmicutes)]